MSVSESAGHGSQAIAEAHRRLENIKEEHKQRMFEDVPDDAKGVLTQSHDRLIVDICEELQEFFPEPEPMEVQQYRALVLSMETVRHSADLRDTYGDPLRVMENVALEYRETALGLIENRIEVDEPTEEGDADVLYLSDPVSKMKKTIAVGGFTLGEDMRMLEDHLKMFAEQILLDPISDTTPRV